MAAPARHAVFHPRRASDSGLPIWKTAGNADKVFRGFWDSDSCDIFRCLIAPFPAAPLYIAVYGIRVPQAARDTDKIQAIRNAVNFFIFWIPEKAVDKSFPLCYNQQRDSLPQWRRALIQ